ncbi:hypothetical protein V8C86DRAFT_1826144, partial [Haematococcus lacustris]
MATRIRAPPPMATRTRIVSVTVTVSITQSVYPALTVRRQFPSQYPALTVRRQVGCEVSLQHITSYKLQPKLFTAITIFTDTKVLQCRKPFTLRREEPAPMLRGAQCILSGTATHRTCFLTPGCRTQERDSGVPSYGRARHVATRHPSSRNPSSTSPDTTSPSPRARHPYEAQDRLSWTSRWWPVEAVDMLDATMPQQVHLLGQDLVVWADSQQRWHVWQDRCPHRLAPLSEGRVLADSLHCSYHGWSFGPDGRCQHIPQLQGPAHDNAIAMPQACVTAYPVRTAHGIVWIWPELGAAAAIRAVETPLPDVMSGPGHSPWYVRLQPIRVDLMLENLLDPSHFPFAHHRPTSQSDSRSSRWMGQRADPPQLAMRVSGPSTREGFCIEQRCQASPSFDMDMQFDAPFKVKYQFLASQRVVQFLAVPTRPGEAKFFFSSQSRPSSPPAWAPWGQPVATWLGNLAIGSEAMEHLHQRHATLDGDAYLLHRA